MAGLPVTIRLLDPPLHEFLPDGEMTEVCLRRSSRGPSQCASTQLPSNAARVQAGSTNSSVAANLSIESVATQ